jgi:hypothetical protein
MTSRRSVLLSALFGLSLLLPARVHADDLLVIADAQLRAPEGWGLLEQGELTTLFREGGGARIEVVRLARVPDADPRAIAESLRARKGIAEVDVTVAAALEQHGLKGTRAEGTARDQGVPVRIRVVALPAGPRAIMAIALVGPKAAEQVQKDVDGILGSLRPQAAGASDEGGLQRDAGALQGKWERTIPATGEGPLGKATRVVKEIKGDKETVTYHDAEGKVLYSHRVDFTLSQSGPVRLFTFSNGEVLEGPNKGSRT